MGYQKRKWLYIFFVVPVRKFSTTLNLKQSHFYGFQLFSCFYVFSQYCSFSFSQVKDFYCQVRLYQHHTIGLLSNHKILLSIINSSCSNSRSWSWYQICDTSFSCITLLVLLKGQVLCVWTFVIVIICCG